MIINQLDSTLAVVRQAVRAYQARLYLSFNGGKDSLLVLHLYCQVLREEGIDP